MHLHQLGWASCAQPPPRKDRNRDVGPQGSNEDKEGTPPPPPADRARDLGRVSHKSCQQSVTGCCPPFSQPLAWPISSRWERIRVGGLVMGSDRRTDVDPAAPSSIKRGSRCLLQDGERRHGRCCASYAGLSLLRRVGRTGAGYRTALPAPESPSFSLSAAMWTPRSCVVGARPSGDQDLGVVCFRGWGWGGAVNEEHRWD